MKHKKKRREGVLKKVRIIGREQELSELQRSMESDRSEFVIVYGRRRVGKTYLVDNFFNYKYDFSYVGGHRLSKPKQLRNFAKAMKKYACLQFQPKYKDWDDAFDALEEYIEGLLVVKTSCLWPAVLLLHGWWTSWLRTRADFMDE